VEFSQNDVQAACFDDSGLKLNIGPAPGHVGRDRDARGLSRLRDDSRFGAILTRIEHSVAR